jgi:hypothetical protein
MMWIRESITSTTKSFNDDDDCQTPGCDGSKRIQRARSTLLRVNSNSRLLTKTGPVQMFPAGCKHMLYNTTDGERHKFLVHKTETPVDVDAAVEI